MTKIINFALKIKRGGREGGRCEVLRPCHLPPKKKFGTCTLQESTVVFLPTPCSYGSDILSARLSATRDFKVGRPCCRLGVAS